MHAVRGARNHRLLETVMALGIAGAVLSYGAGRASADTCTTGPAATVSGDALPFTGLHATELVAVGVALLVIGSALAFGPRLVPAGWARSRRGRRRPPALMIGALLLAAAVLVPGRAVASTTGGCASPSISQTTAPDSSTTTDPPAVVPEAPLAALLPATGVCAAAAVLVVRRRRRGRRRPLPRRHAARR